MIVIASVSCMSNMVRSDYMIDFLTSVSVEDTLTRSWVILPKCVFMFVCVVRLFEIQIIRFIPYLFLYFKK